jgi:hypothetical protein
MTSPFCRRKFDRKKLRSSTVLRSPDIQHDPHKC